MRTITIRDLCQWDRDGESPEFAEPYSIYCFRDGDFILYVGKTKRHIVERLWEHVGFAGQTQMTSLIEDNLPESLGWEIDLFTVLECIPLINKHLKVKRIINECDFDLAEEAMIRESHPAVNRSLNFDGAEMPEKYIRKRLERMRKAFWLYPPSYPKAK